MSEEKKHSVRKSQIITPFGVGSIVESNGESFVIKDLTYWRGDSFSDLGMRDMARSLGVASLKAPVDNKPTVPANRFPTWFFCNKCRNMRRCFGRDFPVCAAGGNNCRGNALTPMRFVQVCRKGHMDDIDWWWWAHKNHRSPDSSCDRDSTKLKFIVSGQGGGDFNTMSIKCENCSASNTLEDLIRGDAPTGLRCSGRQPWVPIAQASQCGEPVWAEPRGSSSIYYPDIASQLDLDTSMGQNSRNAERLRALPQYQTILSIARGIPQDLFKGIYKNLTALAKKNQLDPDECEEILSEDLSGDSEVTREFPEAEPAEFNQTQVYSKEYKILSGKTDVETKFFRTKVHAPIGTEWVSKIVQVRTLREVRALRSFRRRKPEFEPVFPDLGQGSGWLPASEHIGEGIFLQLDDAILSRWENKFKKELSEHTEGMLKKAQDMPAPISDLASIRFILLHTFSHMILLRLAEDCGYSVCSLKERVFAADNEAGILIYTSEGDSEGAMGGLVEAGEPSRFEELLKNAADRSSWCSADPVCRELEDQGFEGLNRAACHACAFLPETSCPYMNVLLDRLLLTGSAARGEINGFFHPETEY